MAKWNQKNKFYRIGRLFVYPIRFFLVTKKLTNMKTLKSSTGRKFEITSNKSARTFTVRVDGSKYRTYPMSKEEFNSASYWTGEDWNYFLRNTNDYYKVK